jgi:hypothetical protein
MHHTDPFADTGWDEADAAAPARGPAADAGFFIATRRNRLSAWTCFPVLFTQAERAADAVQLLKARSRDEHEFRVVSIAATEGAKDGPRDW